MTYLTGVSDVDLADLYRRAWVYASPSTYEGFGLPYLEAMACGTPVVASENPGSVDVLGHDGCGLLPADEEFAATIAALLGDEARRAELSAAGLRRVPQFTLDADARRLREGALRSDRGVCQVHGFRLARSPTTLTTLARFPRRRTSEWWGVAEAFIAMQLLWGLVLFIPGAQAYRPVVRAIPYVVSGAAVVYYFRHATGERLPEQHASGSSCPSCCCC